MATKAITDSTQATEARIAELNEARLSGDWIDEMNFGRMLHWVPEDYKVGQDKRGNPIAVFSSHRWDSEKNQVIEQEIRMSSKADLPNERDYENLRAAIGYALESNQIRKGRLRFPVSALLTVKHQSCGGERTNEIKRSIDRYANVRYEYKNCWWDKEKKKFLEKYSTNVIASYGITSKRDGDSESEVLIVWNPDYHRGLLTNYYRFAQADYFDIPRGASRRAFTYVMAEKARRGNCLRIWVDLDEFYDNVLRLKGKRSGWRMKDRVNEKLRPLENRGIVAKESNAKRYRPKRTTNGRCSAGKWQIGLQVLSRAKKHEAIQCSDVDTEMQALAKELTQQFLEKVLRKNLGEKRTTVQPGEITIAMRLLRKHGTVDVNRFMRVAKKVVLAKAPNAKTFKAVEWYENEIVSDYKKATQKEGHGTAGYESPQQPESNTDYHQEARHLWDEVLSETDKEEQRNGHRRKYATHPSDTLIDIDCISAIETRLRQGDTNLRAMIDRERK